MSDTYSKRLWADFNGLFGRILCLSHKDYSTDEEGNQVPLRDGLIVTAYMEDEDHDGKRDNVIASGVVRRSPDWLQCKGSRWALEIDEHGVRHESDL